LLAVPAKKRPSSHTRTYVILSDLQIPFEDTKAVELALDFIADIKPHGVVLNGDVVDCYSLSDFDKDPLQKTTLANEIEMAGRLMARLVKVPEKWWLLGNHEDRLRRALWRNPAFADIKELAFPQLFHLADYGFQSMDYGEVLKLGHLSVTHGDLVRAGSGATARAHLDRFGSSVLVGHTHRLAAVYRTNGTGVHGAYENGSLCSQHPEYIKRPDWQLGWSVVHVGKGGLFTVQQIAVLAGYQFFYGPHHYTSRKDR
jgi:metallophosphoesterase superfamily enzyme